MEADEKQQSYRENQQAYSLSVSNSNYANQQTRESPVST